MNYYLTHIDEYCIGPFASINNAHKFAEQQQFSEEDFRIVAENELVREEKNITVTAKEFMESKE